MATATFAIIPTTDISALGKLKASGCAVLLYSALLSYARNKCSAFPSIATLSKAIGGAYTDTGIYKALKWLENNKFIKRNDRRSKQRFVMLRKVAKATLTHVNAALSQTKVTDNRNRKNNSFLRRRTNKRKAFSSFSKRTKSSQEYPKLSQPEKIWSDFVYETGGKDLKELSAEKIAIMGQFLRSPKPEAVEWREIMWDHNKDVFLAIKRATAPGYPNYPQQQPSSLS